MADGVHASGAVARAARVPVRHRRPVACAADPASARGRGVHRGVRRGAADLGGGSPEQVARGDLLGPVSLVRASAVRRIVGDGRRPGGRIGQPDRRSGRHRSTWRPRSRRRSEAKRRFCARSSATRTIATAAARRARVMPSRDAALCARAGDGQSRVSCGGRRRPRRVAARLKATYNGVFWRTAGTP